MLSLGLPTAWSCGTFQTLMREIQARNSILLERLWLPSYSLVRPIPAVRLNCKCNLFRKPVAVSALEDPLCAPDAQKPTVSRLQPHLPVQDRQPMAESLSPALPRPLLDFTPTQSRE